MSPRLSGHIYIHLVKERLTDAFIIESLKFFLENNFVFDGGYYQQIDRTAMGKKVAPVFACLTIAYLEESKLFTAVLPMYFKPE